MKEFVDIVTREAEPVEFYVACNTCKKLYQEMESHGYVKSHPHSRQP